MTKAKHFRSEGCVEEASVSIGGIRYDLPVRKGTLGPAVVDITTLYQTQAVSRTTRGSPRRQVANRRSRLSTSTKGSYSIAAIRSNN